MTSAVAKSHLLSICPAPFVCVCVSVALGFYVEAITKFYYVQMVPFECVKTC